MIPPWAAHGLALLLVVTGAVVRAVRLRLLTPSSEPMSLWRYIVINAYGEAASAVTPGRLGGEPARFFAMKRAGTATAPAATALASERAIDLSLIAVVGVVLGALFGQQGVGGLLRGFRQLSDGVLALSVGALAVLVGVGWLALRRYRSRMGAAEASKVPRQPVRLAPASALAGATALGFVNIACRVGILPVLCLSLPISVEWGSAVLGSFALLYSQLVLPTPAGLGGVEMGFALGFAGHLTPSAIAGLLLAWRVYTLGIGAAAGAAFAARGMLRAARGAVRVCLLLAALLAGASTSAAQSIPLGSRNLAVGHWSYDAIQQLRTRGYLSNLNATVQPYRRLEVAQGLAGLSPEALPSPVAHWVRLLRQELKPELERIEGAAQRPWGAQFSGGARASTGERLDALRQMGDGDAWPWYQAGAWAESGPLAAETRLLGDYFLEDDPDGLPPGQRRYGRADNAYLSVTFPLGNVTLGRLRRNWTVHGADGLMLSAAATAYPQLASELTVGRFALRSLTGELDTVLGTKRYVAGHRFDFQAPNLVLSFGETILYATNNGVLLRFLNPMEFLFFDHDNAPPDGTQNLTLDWQIWWRPGPVTLSGELMLDDLDVIPGTRDPEPTLYALRIGVEETSLLPGVDVAVEYQRVSAFVYRTPNVVDNYTYLQRGLGTNFSDFDLVTALVDVHPPLPGLRLTPLVQILRQGEGDLRYAIPPMAEYLASRSIFLGTTERTIRLGVRGRYQPTRHIWLGFDVGRNFVTNAEHVQDRVRAEFAGTASLGVTLDVPRR